MTVSNLLFKKEQCEWFAHDSSEWLAKIGVNRSKNSYFSYVFDSLPPFFAQERSAPVALCSLLIHSFLKSDQSDSLPLLFLKKWLEGFAPAASDHELFARVVNDKRATEAIRSFSQANCSFAHKKREVLEKPMSEFPILIDSFIIQVCYFNHSCFSSVLKNKQKYQK